jgi:hypothetical protein
MWHNSGFIYLWSVKWKHVIYSLAHPTLLMLTTVVTTNKINCPPCNSCRVPYLRREGENLWSGGCLLYVVLIS